MQKFDIAREGGVEVLLDVRQNGIRASPFVPLCLYSAATSQHSKPAFFICLQAAFACASLANRLSRARYIVSPVGNGTRMMNAGCAFSAAAPSASFTLSSFSLACSSAAKAPTWTWNGPCWSFCGFCGNRGRQSLRGLVPCLGYANRLRRLNRRSSLRKWIERRCFERGYLGLPRCLVIHRNILRSRRGDGGERLIADDLVRGRGYVSGAAARVLLCLVLGFIGRCVGGLGRRVECGPGPGDESPASIEARRIEIEARSGRLFNRE